MSEQNLHFDSPHKRLPDIADMTEAIRRGDRIKLGQAITLIESTRADHQMQARELINYCLPHSGKSIRIGVTGSPGVGKSTFIEALGSYLVNQNKKVAVLAIDPTSQISKGSILGDKTRMEKLSNHPLAFVRPSPAGESLGGVARKTREAIILCETAGYEVIFVETVGVGQSETAVHSMVDIFLLLLLPGAGDELQGIKRGIVEMADIIIVNKADGERLNLAKQARQAYANALHFLLPKESGWVPKFMTCSALYETGIAETWALIESFSAFSKENLFFEKNRKQQAGYWFYQSLREGLERSFFENEIIKQQLKKAEAEVLEQKRSPFEAAQALLDFFLKSVK